MLPCSGTWGNVHVSMVMYDVTKGYLRGDTRQGKYNTNPSHVSRSYRPKDT